MNFSNKLLSWYLQNKRDLPWRNTKEPYKVWLSEIILQQTRVNQGLNYYLKFIESFPTVYDLAKADEDTILKLWQGLGYYSRARNLHFTAKYIVNNFNGTFPKTYKELIKLKGIGDYTASAISSICNNEPNAVVDGNVYRVLARYFDISTAINSGKGIKEFKNLAQQLIVREKPGYYNQAIMELGATICKPKKPNCNSCVLNDSCLALQKNKISKLPVKEKKLKIKHRYFNYLVTITNQDSTILKKRETKDIWKKLYEFPLIETSAEVDLEQLIKLNEFQNIYHNFITIKLHNSKNIIHKLSHQTLHAKYWIVTTNSVNMPTINWDEISKYPVPTLLHNFINEFTSN